MKGPKKVLFVFTILIISIGLVTAAAIQIPASEKAKEKSQAGEKSPIIDNDFNLYPPGLEKIVLIHYKKGFAKPPWAGGGKGDTSSSNCYQFYGKDVKWKNTPVDLVIDPDNPYGLSQDFVVSAFLNGAGEWDTHTSTNLLGSYSIDYGATWDGDLNGDGILDSSPDNRNELLFGNYYESGVIGVTNVWGYFSGPPSTRRIVEFDIVFDTDFTWGDATVNPMVMDLQNIATHEIGHGFGMSDLYDTVCIDETMYGYSTEGETEKRTLNTGDIEGIQKLYGK